MGERPAVLTLHNADDLQSALLDGELLLSLPEVQNLIERDQPIRAERRECYSRILSCAKAAAVIICDGTFSDEVPQDRRTFLHVRAVLYLARTARDEEKSLGVDLKVKSPDAVATPAFKGRIEVYREASRRLVPHLLLRAAQQAIGAAPSVLSMLAKEMKDYGLEEAIWEEEGDFTVYDPLTLRTRLAEAVAQCRNPGEKHLEWLLNLADEVRKEGGSLETKFTVAEPGGRLVPEVGTVEEEELYHRLLEFAGRGSVSPLHQVEAYFFMARAVERRCSEGNKEQKKLRHPRWIVKDGLESEYIALTCYSLARREADGSCCIPTLVLDDYYREREPHVRLEAEHMMRVEQTLLDRHRKLEDLAKYQ